MDQASCDASGFGRSPGGIQSAAPAVNVAQLTTFLTELRHFRAEAGRPTQIGRFRLGVVGLSWRFEAPRPAPIWGVCLCAWDRCFALALSVSDWSSLRKLSLGRTTAAGATTTGTGAITITTRTRARFTAV